ncbi:hypothetical protein MKW98_016551 [Papaver atlanticum]|uniref:Uncharacterized protein n=1 Tax=Papaver atlanticum TaxID=357466 RepID=A0AAD4X558_9MAGN|nr:hypothetical protein MKW98_016551 [Papaver atlanticum]
MAYIEKSHRRTQFYRWLSCSKENMDNSTKKISTRDAMFGFNHFNVAFSRFKNANKADIKSGMCTFPKESRQR